MKGTGFALILAVLLTSPPTDSETASEDLVEKAESDGSFMTLTSALHAVGLKEALKSSGPFTMFAPTDEAFKKLPAGTLEWLLRPENKAKLKALLTYHVLPGSLKKAQVTGMLSARTLNGQEVAFVSHGDRVMINDAKLVKVDITALNGVIHVIDTVLLPPAQ